MAKQSLGKTSKAIKEQVSAVLADIRPLIQQDGGDISLISVDEQGVVEVQLHGACIGCPSSAMTLTLGIERTLKERIPEISRVICA